MKSALDDFAGLIAGVLAAGALLTGAAGVIGAGIALTAGPATATTGRGLRGGAGT